jgi:Na+/melibiose symporter-like transporter
MCVYVSVNDVPSCALLCVRKVFSNVCMCVCVMWWRKQVLIPFYLLDYLKLDTSSITIVPFILYIAQLASTFFMKWINARLGRRDTLLLGSVFVLLPCVGMWWIDSDTWYCIYPAVAVLGVGSAIVLVTSQQLQADLVGLNTASAAFVYGAHSFTDKVSNGVAIFVIQQINGDAMVYVRQALVFVPTASILAAVVLTVTLNMDELMSPPSVIVEKAACAAVASALPVAPAAAFGSTASDSAPSGLQFIQYQPIHDSEAPI